MEGRSDWGRFDFGTFRRRDVLTMGRFDCKAHSQLLPQHPRHLMDSNYIIRMLYKISTDFTTTTFIFMFKN